MPNALESRVNASVMARIANARGDFGAADFPVIFENGSVDTLVGVSALQPTALVEDAQLAGCVAQQTQLRINGETAYLVVDIQPDGTGLSRLVLQAA